MVVTHVPEGNSEYAALSWQSITQEAHTLPIDKKTLKMDTIQLSKISETLRIATKLHSSIINMPGLLWFCKRVPPCPEGRTVGTDLITTPHKCAGR